MGRPFIKHRTSHLTIELSDERRAPRGCPDSHGAEDTSIGFRLGSRARGARRVPKGYAGLLHEDVKIRRFIKSSLYHAGISRIDIERSANRACISILRAAGYHHRARGRVEKLKNEIRCAQAKEVYLNIEE
jgi:small subunit ribosomal protein S3